LVFNRGTISILSFFDSIPNVEELLKYNPPNNFIKGQPIFPLLKQGTKIQQLIGPNSWYIFIAPNYSGDCIAYKKFSIMGQ
jgi:hypothetical protein